MSSGIDHLMIASLMGPVVKRLKKDQSKSVQCALSLAYVGYTIYGIAQAAKRKRKKI